MASVLVFVFPAIVGLAGSVTSELVVMAMVSLFVVALTLPVVSPLGVLPSLRTARVGSVMAISFGIQFGLAPLLWLGEIPTWATVSATELLPAAHMVLLGWVVLSAGYYFATLISTSDPDNFLELSKCRNHNHTLRQRFSPSIQATIALLLLGILAKIYLLATGSFGFSRDVSQAVYNPSNLGLLINILGMGIDLAILLSFGQMMRCGSKSAWRVLAFSSLTIALLFGILSGTKAGFLLPLLAAIVGAAMNGGVVRLRWLVAILLFFVFVLTPFVSEFRKEARGGSGVAVTSVEGITGVFDEYATGVQNGDSAPFQFSLWRFNQLNQAAPVFELSPATVPFKSPQELVTGTLSLIIPRFIWADKPVYTPGLDITREYFNSDVLTASAITPFGDLFRHGGLVPLLAGSLFLGVLARAYDWAWQRFLWPMGGVISFLGMVPLLQMEGNFVEFAVEIPLVVLTALYVHLVLWFLRNRHHSGMLTTTIAANGQLRRGRGLGRLAE